MEPTTAPPPPPPLSTGAAASASAYPDSLDSSPRSRNTDSWGEDNSQYASKHGSAAAAAAAPVSLTKLRLMCSYGGHIVPRPHDKSLCYVGGDTRIVVVDRHTTLSELTQRLSKTLLRSSSSSSISSATSSSFTLKYQLPSEDLDSLISVTTDEDLENMIEEYERLNSSSDFNKSSRLRLFIFPANNESVSSIGSLLESSIKSEDWFLNALNGTTSGFSDTSSVNCLLGLDEEVSIQEKKDVNNKGVIGKNFKGNNSVQDVHSIPDSPMLERSSSFGSASSAPSLASLPPIRVHVDDNQKIGGGIEEQFSQMSVQQQHQKYQEDGGFVAPPSQVVATGVPINSAAGMAEYPNRVFSDDERSDQGLQMAYRNQQQQQQSQQQQQQYQQKQSTGFDMASPESVSSDGSRQKPSMIFQNPMVQMQYSNSNNQAAEGDQNTRIQMLQQQQQQQQQIQDSAYLMSMSNPQIDPQHPQLHHHQPQFIHTAIPQQYIQSHPSGAVPMASYYQMYPSQGQHHPHHPALDQQNFVYYMPAGQAPQGYNLPLQQQQQQQQQAPSYGDASNASFAAPPRAHNQAQQASGAYTTSRTPQATSKSELPQGYTKSGAPYMGYSQIHHPSQSVASSTSGSGGNYGYEFTDPAQQVQHIYYAAQPLPPQSTAQYQTMASNSPVEPGSHLSADQQQARTSQP